MRPYSKDFRPRGMSFWRLDSAASKWIETLHSSFWGLKGSICYPYVITEHPTVFVAPHSASRVAHTPTRWLIGAPCVECLGGWGMENSSSLPLAHFFQASGIHWVGVQLLDGVVASWLGRRGRQKVAAGHLRVVGVYPHKGFWFSCLFASLRSVIEGNTGGVKRFVFFLLLSLSLFFFFCLF